MEELSFGVLVEGQIAKYGSEEVHGEHAKDGNIADILHSPLCWVAQFSVDWKHFRVTYKSKCQYRDGICCLLVDGEEFGSTCVFWDNCFHRIVSKCFQRTSNVKSLVDDHREEKDHAGERKATCITKIPQMLHHGQWQDDADSDDDNQVISIHEPVIRARCLAKKGLDDQW